MTRWTERNSSGKSRIIVGIHLIKHACSLKKVQGKKKRDADVAEAQRKALGETEESSEGPVIAGGGGDLLGSKDEDVIF